MQAMVILQAVNIQWLYLLELLIYIKGLCSLAASKTVSELLKERIVCSLLLFIKVSCSCPNCYVKSSSRYFYDPGHSLTSLNNKTK